MSRRTELPSTTPSKRTPDSRVRRESSDETPFLSRHEAAAFLRVNPQTIDLLIRDGSLRASRVRRRVIVRRDDLLRYAERNEVK